MKISDLFQMSLSSLWKRKVRTILTVIGVVIGTTSIVVMMSLGVGMNASFQESLESMGDLTTIQVYGGYSTTNEPVVLDDTTLETFNLIPHVSQSFGVYQAWGDFKIKSGKLQFNQTIVGIDLVNAPLFGYELHKGETITVLDDENTVYAGQLAGFFFNDPSSNEWNYPQSDENGNYPEPDFDVMSKRLRISANSWQTDQYGNPTARPKEYTLHVKGIVKGNYDKPGAQDGILISKELFLKLRKEFYRINQTEEEYQDFNYSDVRVKVDKLENVSEVENQIKQLGYQTYSMESMRQSMEEQTMMIQMALGGIGAISLLVAAIGITNTMIMSIYERTREIGVMKVLGCKLNDIRMMFLAEAAMIGLIGGVAGIGLSYGLSAIINQVVSNMGGIKISLIPLWLVLLGLGFAVGVGLIAGFYPANRAVKISALSAIRQE